MTMRTACLSYLILLISICSSPSAYAQIEKSLKFNPETLDFGNIRETDGPVTKTVQAINISADSTFVISARTSCGCSEAEFDARTMAPGDSTTVTITYDPTNRPGKFLKSAKIFTGTERISNTFRLKGTVIPSRKHLDKVYPEKAGNLRLSTLIVSAGEIRPSETKPLFVGIYNDSDTAINLNADSDSDAVETSLQPQTIEPFGIATLSITLKGRDMNEATSNFKYAIRIKDIDKDETLTSIPIVGNIKAPK